MKNSERFPQIFCHVKLVDSNGLLFDMGGDVQINKFEQINLHIVVPNKTCTFTVNLKLIAVTLSSDLLYIGWWAKTPFQLLLYLSDKLNTNTDQCYDPICFQLYGEFVN